MNRPAQVPASESELSSDVHRPIREAIEKLRPGGSSIEYVKAAIADVLYRDLQQAAALRALLDESHENRSLSMENYRRLSTELHRLVTEEIPTDGIPQPSPRIRERKPKTRAARVSAGSVLGRRYQLEECVAEGPLSDVYRAGDRWRAELTAGNASVAVKLLAPLADGIVDRDKLRRQALLAQQLAHPAICRVLAVDRDGDTDFAVLEWLEGESLASLMDRIHPEPLGATTVRAVVEATAAALEHALDHGLVHGDLKPANVFVCDDGSIKLLDFGLERGASAAPAITPDYASCEILEGRAPEPADDIYSFAVMIYRALTGSRPYGRRTALEAEADGAQPARVPGLDEEQWACLGRALAFRRAERDIGAVRLAATLSRSPLATRASDVSPPKRPKSWRLAAVLVVLTVVVSLLAANWWQKQERPVPVVTSPVVEPSLRTRQAGPAPGEDARPPQAEDGAEANGPLVAPAAEPRRVEPVKPAGNLASDPAAFEATPVADEPVSGGTFDPSLVEPEQKSSPSAVEPEPIAEPIVEPSVPAVSSATATDPAVASVREETAVPAPLSVPGGRVGFRDNLYEVDESEGFVKLRLRAPPRHPGIRLRLRAGAGSAELGSDFALAEQMIEIEPGQTRTEVLWPLVDDARDEYLEDVELLLESQTDDYPVTQADALVIIFDDDGPEVVSEELVQP